jgi:O-methyltransferase / aklanonic acid methyltransferase
VSREEATREVDAVIEELSRPLEAPEARAGWTDETRLGVLEHFRRVQSLLADPRPWTFARQAPLFARGFDGMPDNRLLDRIVHVEHVLEEAKRDYVVSLLDRIAPTFDRVGPPVFSQFGRRIVELVDVQPGASVLDLGTRTGHVLVPAAEAVGGSGRVVGFDVSPMMVTATKEEIERRRFASAEARLVDWWGGLGEREGTPGENKDLFERLFETLDYNAYLCAFGLPFLQSSWLVSSLVVHAGRSRAPLGLVFERDRGPEWEWYDALLSRYGADYELVERPLNTRAEVDEFCDLWELRAKEIVEETSTLVFRSEDEWWEWIWSHDWRAQLELIPESALASFREEAYGHLRESKERDGFKLPFNALLVLAEPTPG